MAALEAAYCTFSSSCLSSSCLPKFPNSPSTILHLSISNPSLFLKAPPCPLPLLSIHQTRKSSSFKVWSAVEEIAVEVKPEQVEETQQQPEQGEETQLSELRKKLFVLNLPWSFKVEDIKNLFGECGTVASVEIIMQKGGKSRGYAFVAMASGEEAQAVIDKFNSHELLGRIISVEFAKSFRRPAPPSSSSLVGETRHELYVTNLAWKVRSNHLREFFAAGSNAVSARVIFEGRRSAGYGFAAFTTKEEAESAIAALDGKELMGRPLRLRFSEKNIEESKDGKEEEATSEEPQGHD